MKSKRVFRNILAIAMLFVGSLSILTGCSCSKKSDALSIHREEITGFAPAILNSDAKIKETSLRYYEVTGTIDYVDNETATTWDSTGAMGNNILVLKLKAEDKVVLADVKGTVEGTTKNSFTGANLDGEDYIYVGLGARKGAKYTIKATWNKDDGERTYTVKFSDNIVLETNTSTQE